MDSRLVLWMMVAMAWLLLYQAWERDSAPAAVASVEQPSDALPSVADSIAPPVLGDSSNQTTNTAQPALNQTADTTTPKVRVITDVYDLYIDTTGASLREVTLKNYPKRKDQPDIKMVLLQPGVTALQTGLLAAAGREAPTHDSVYSAASQSYEMNPGSDTLEVTFNWQGDGVSVDKTYVNMNGMILQRTLLPERD